MTNNPDVIAVAAAIGKGKRKRSGRATFLFWLRKVHLYIGLWGAVLGLLFGVTGILLNHRVVMKIPVEKAVQTTIEMQLPHGDFRNPEQLAAWIEKELKLELAQPAFIKTQPARHVLWGDNLVQQPERWSISFHRPDRAVNAEYFVGSKVVRLENADSTPLGTLVRLHMSVGVTAAWIVLADTIAGGLILLSITGLLLWTQLHTVRTVAVFVSLGGLFAGMWIAWPLI